MSNATLASKLKSQLIPAYTHVSVTQRGEAERAVGARVLLVANSNQRKFQQSELQSATTRACGNPDLRRSWATRRRNARQTPPELQHSIKLRRVAVGTPTGVIAILLASASVTSSGLQMAARLRQIQTSL